MNLAVSHPSNYTTVKQEIAILLTALITVTTIIYTVYSIRLWKTSNQSAAIARQAALVNMWSELNRYTEECRKQNLPQTPILEKLSGIFAEYMLTSLFHELNTKKDAGLQQFQNRIEQLVVNSELNMETLPWLASFIKQVNK